MPRTFIALFMLYSVILGSTVVWSYDLTSLPDGWYADSVWSFGLDGAVLDITEGEPYQTTLGSIVTDWIMIPDNCDSIVLHVEQDLYTFSYVGGTAEAALKYRNNDMEWHSLDIGYPVTTDPIHALLPLYPVQGLSFKFFGAAVGGSPYNPGYGDVVWKLWDLSLTIYGDSLTMESTTWAAIKSMSH